MQTHPSRRFPLSYSIYLNKMHYLIQVYYVQPLVNLVTKYFINRILRHLILLWKGPDHSVMRCNIYINILYIYMCACMREREREIRVAFYALIQEIVQLF